MTNQEAIEKVEKHSFGLAKLGINPDLMSAFEIVIPLARREGLEREELAEFLFCDENLLDRRKGDYGYERTIENCRKVADAICTRFCSPEFPEEKVRQTIVQVGKTYEEIIQALKNLWEGK